MALIDRILSIDFPSWEQLTENYEIETKNLKIPVENSIETLYFFTSRLDDLYTRVVYDYGRARRNKESMDAFMESILKDLYEGKNDLARKAGGIQYARHFPAPDSWHEETVNLFDVHDQILGYYYSLQSSIKAIEIKANSKVTSNSLLKLESSLV